MNREQAKEILPIIQAFIDGKQIQHLYNKWEDIENLTSDLIINPELYRIKPEPKYRPFQNAEECWEEMQKHSDFGWVKFCNSICFIQNISFNKITVISDEEICSTSFEGGFTNMKFTDGTPFGIKEY